MKTETYIKTYGIEESYYKGKKRFFVVCDDRTTSLHYAKADFALKKSQGFVRAVFQDFLRSRDEVQVHFEFKLQERTEL